MNLREAPRSPNVGLRRTLATTFLEIEGLLAVVAAGWPDVNAAIARSPEPMFR